MSGPYDLIMLHLPKITMHSTDTKTKVEQPPSSDHNKNANALHYYNNIMIAFVKCLDKKGFLF
jgi:hypothetical protein